jgi:MoaA/NifB/PqqE/SkfB family radical SAM enzyme
LCSQLKTIKDKQRQMPFRVYTYPEMDPDDLARYYSAKPRYLKSTCCSRWSRVDIMPDGTVTPCLSYKVGNIRKESFMHIWNSSRYRDFRKKLNRQGAWPGCIRCCGLFSD